MGAKTEDAIVYYAFASFPKKTTLQAEPLLTPPCKKEQKERLCGNRVISVKSPQSRFLD